MVALQGWPKRVHEGFGVIVLMSWWYKDPKHQHMRYMLSLPAIFWDNRPIGFTDRRMRSHSVSTNMSRKKGIQWHRKLLPVTDLLCFRVREICQEKRISWHRKVSPTNDFNHRGGRHVASSFAHKPLPLAMLTQMAIGYLGTDFSDNTIQITILYSGWYF